jgi:hypothetical protein
VAVDDGIHDLGGMHGFGAVVAPAGEAPYHERWEARVFALHLLVEPERLGASAITTRPDSQVALRARALEALLRPSAACSPDRQARSRSGRRCQVSARHQTTDLAVGETTWPARLR